MKTDLAAVANDVAAIVASLFGETPPPLRLPVVCMVGKIPRATLAPDWDAPTRIEIRVTVADRKFNQFARQVGHELGHVMIGARRTNSVIEMVADAIALEVLDKLAAKWSQHSHVPWRSEAHKFTEYRELVERDALALTKLDALWLKRRVADIERRLRDENRTRDVSEAGLQDETGRALQVVGAMLIRSDFTRWSAFADLEACAGPASRDYRRAAMTAACVRQRAPQLVRLVP